MTMLPATFDDVYRTDYGSIALVAGATAGNWTRGEEIAQEAFARAHQDWDHVRDLERPGAWIRRVAINLALNARRASRRERAALTRLAAVTVPCPSEHGPDLPDTTLWIAVETLPPRQRAAVVLRYHDDYSTREIAEIMQATETAITTSLHKARARLAAQLENRQ